MKKVLMTLFHNPRKILIILLYKFARLFPDRLYIRLMFFLRVGYSLNLETPQTFNEKIQWLKLNYRKPEFCDMVDKYSVKKYVANIIGANHIIPTIGMYDSVDEIDWDHLPTKFVLKCTHDSGGVIVVRDKSQLNIEDVKRKLKKHLRQSFYYQGREWPYKKVKHRIIAEEYMTDESSGDELKDYKFFCFNGVPRLFFIATDRNKADEEVKFDFYDMEFNHLNIINGHPNSNRKQMKPDGFERMIEIASTLSKGHPHIRIDLYNVKGEIYFGEMTFYHFNGFTPFVPKEWDYKLGEMIQLPNH